MTRRSPRYVNTRMRPTTSGTFSCSRKVGGSLAVVTVALLLLAFTCLSSDAGGQVPPHTSSTPAQITDGKVEPGGVGDGGGGNGRRGGSTALSPPLLRPSRQTSQRIATQPSDEDEVAVQVVGGAGGKATGPRPDHRLLLLGNDIFAAKTSSATTTATASASVQKKWRPKRKPCEEIERCKRENFSRRREKQREKCISKCERQRKKAKKQRKREKKLERDKLEQEQLELEQKEQNNNSTEKETKQPNDGECTSGDGCESGNCWTLSDDDFAAGICRTGCGNDTDCDTGQACYRGLARGAENGTCWGINACTDDADCPSDACYFGFLPPQYPGGCSCNTDTNSGCNNGEVCADLQFVADYGPACVSDVGGNCTEDTTSYSLECASGNCFAGSCQECSPDFGPNLGCDGGASCVLEGDRYVCQEGASTPAILNETDGSNATFANETGAAAGGNSTASEELNETDGNTTSTNETGVAAGGNSTANDDLNGTGGNATFTNETGADAAGNSTANDVLNETYGNATSSTNETGAAAGGNSTANDELNETGANATSSTNETSASVGNSTANDELNGTDGNATSTNETDVAAGGNATASEELNETDGNATSTNETDAAAAGNSTANGTILNSTL